MIKNVVRYTKNENEAGATISIWYMVIYECGRAREFKKLSKAAEKFMKKSECTFFSELSPVGYYDSKGEVRGEGNKSCDYGYTLYTHIFG